MIPPCVTLNIVGISFKFWALVVGLAMLATGCGDTEPGNPRFTSKNGVRYYDRAATELDVVSANDPEDQLLEIHADAKGCLGRAWVELMGQRLWNGTAYVDGLQRGGHVQVYALPSRLAPSSWTLRHELLHHLKECNEGNADSDHSGPEWIYVGGVAR
jgi:hypothetical protein